MRAQEQGVGHAIKSKANQMAEAKKIKIRWERNIEWSIFLSMCEMLALPKYTNIFNLKFNLLLLIPLMDCTGRFCFITDL